MDFSILLCSLFNHLGGEKTPYAGFHLLRGKRSGQMMQDVAYYGVHPFFGILPKLSKAHFDAAIKELEHKRLITIDEHSILHLTEEGKRLVQFARTSHFDGWNYRGREEIFFARLSLIVQTLSHFKEGVKQFMPVQREPEVQQFVKVFLRNYPIHDPTFSAQLKKELYEALEDSQVTDEQKGVFTHRLVGYQSTGWTWGQLGEQLAVSPLNVKLSYIESLHMLLNTIIGVERYPLLNRIAYQIKVENHLNDSTRRTKILFDQGCSLEEIAMIRQLKASTIEDHIVEIALDNKQFPFEKFVEIEDCLAVQKKSEVLETKRLRLLKESFPQLSYFQLRLILSVPSKGVNSE